MFSRRCRDNTLLCYPFKYILVYMISSHKLVFLDFKCTKSLQKMIKILSLSSCQRVTSGQRLDKFLNYVVVGVYFQEAHLTLTV